MLLFLPFSSLYCVWYETPYPKSSIKNFENFQHKLVGSTVSTGHTIAYLDDNSVWRIDPKDLDIFNKWLPGETVHLDPYWDLRNWKYVTQFYNHDRKENVIVMMLESPLTVIASDSPKYLMTLPNPLLYFLFFLPKPVAILSPNWTKYLNYYRKHITLSDGSEFIIDSEEYDEDVFLVGSPAYIGYRELHTAFQGDIVSFCVYSGRIDSVHRWAAFYENKNTK